MAVFAVHLSGDHPDEQAETLEDAYPGDRHYRVSDRFYLVRTSALSNDVADKLGMTGAEDGQSGAVFKLNKAYAGWDRRTMWEWVASGERSE